MHEDITDLCAKEEALFAKKEFIDALFAKLLLRLKNAMFTEAAVIDTAKLYRLVASYKFSVDELAAISAVKERQIHASILVDSSVASSLKEREAAAYLDKEFCVAHLTRERLEALALELYRLIKLLEQILSMIANKSKNISELSNETAGQNGLSRAAK